MNQETIEALCKKEKANRSHAPSLGGAVMTPSIQVWADKCHDRPAPNWLLTLAIGIEHAGLVPGHDYMSAYPQAWAVVDNFGNLVRVERFGL